MGKTWRYLLYLTTLLLSLIMIVIFTFPDTKLHLIACNVGQGDAILVVMGEMQILIDGGPNRDVIDCLSKYIPFWDRKIEVVILTHPEKDHFGGLIEVYKRYQVEKFVASSLNNSTYEYQVLKDLVGGSGTETINPVPGMVIGNSMMHIDIVYPNEELLSRGEGNLKSNILGSFTSDDSANIFSLVAKLSLGEFDALLLGDITPEVSDVVEEELKKSTKEGLEYIKVPHHGSKNGLTQDLLKLIKPEVAVISVGENQWGHPHQEILEMLKKQDVEIFRTDVSGDIHLVSDGRTWYIKKGGFGRKD